MKCDVLPSSRYFLKAEKTEDGFFRRVCISTVKEYSSLKEYILQTFSVTEIEKNKKNDENMWEIIWNAHLGRASNIIAANSRIGAGNIVYTSSKKLVIRNKNLTHLRFEKFLEKDIDTNWALVLFSSEHYPAFVYATSINGIKVIENPEIKNLGKLIKINQI